MRPFLQKKNRWCIVSTTLKGMLLNLTSDSGKNHCLKNVSTMMYLKNKWDHCIAVRDTWSKNEKLQIKQTGD